MQRSSIINTSPEEIIAGNRTTASPFQIAKLRKEAARNWNLCHKRSKQLFKDRHWTDKELFDGLLSRPGEAPQVILETGCGTGSLVYPLLTQYPRLRFHACDFATTAVDEVRKHAEYTPDRVHAFEHDLTKLEHDVYQCLQAHKLDLPTSEDYRVDLVSCVFVLSAIPPDRHDLVVEKLVACLKPGGFFVLRDYALHDAAQLRFHTRPSQNYSDPNLLDAEKPLYCRSDQTMSYFFDVNEVASLFSRHNLVQEKCEYVDRLTENRKEEITLKRRFVQGVWRKP